MAKAPGRLAVLSKNGVAIGGCRTTTIKFAAESIDVTDKDSNGIMTVLAAAATQQITLSIEGVYTDPVLRDIALDAAISKLLTDITMKHSDALAAKDTISGNFFMTDYEESNPHDGATDFSATFSSSGPWTIS